MSNHLTAHNDRRVRKRRITTLFTMLLMLFGLSASVSFSPLVQERQDNSQSDFQNLYRQIINGNLIALDELRNRAIQSSDFYWLEQLAALNDVDAMIALANLSPRESTQLSWFRRAATLGSSQAQFKLGLSASDPEERETMLIASAEQGFVSAQHALANWYVLNTDYEKAIPWLEKTFTVYAQDAMTLANVRWQKDQVAEAVEAFNIAATLGANEAQAYAGFAVNGTDELQSLINTSLQFRKITPTTSVARDTDCVMRIAIVAKSLTNRVQAQRFFHQVTHDQRLVDIPMCFSEPVWLDDDDLPCDVAARGGAQRMMCNAGTLGEWIERSAITHLVVLNPSHKAYVDAGIMYLDSQDTYSVFVHELAHFAGFADEYPIAKNLARVHCAQQTAPNLVFLGDIHYQPLERIQQWQQLLNRFPNQQHAIVPTRTCNNIGQQAFKPTSTRTFMEFHDTGNIPLIYREMWRLQLEEKRHWLPVFVNIARDYEWQGDAALAKAWYDRANRSLTVDTVSGTDQPTSM